MNVPTATTSRPMVTHRHSPPRRCRPRLAVKACPGVLIYPLIGRPRVVAYPPSTVPAAATTTGAEATTTTAGELPPADGMAKDCVRPGGTETDESRDGVAT